MYPKPCWNLRSFPKGERNCYNIKVKPDTKYLIRATFVYGNYDGLNAVPSFDLYLGPNMWTRVVHANDTNKEVIHVTAGSQSLLQICLVNTRTGTPFINVLELRPLDPKAYGNPSGSLKNLFRWYLGPSEVPKIRYPDDVYDRLWYPRKFPEKLWMPVATHLRVNTNNMYNPPEIVMMTAATLLNANATTLDVDWILEPPTAQCYPYTYFSELQTLGENDTREFSVFLNGALVYGPLTPEPLRANTVFIALPKQCTDGKCVLQITKTSRSTLPPVLSAVEVYTVMDNPQLGTNGSDVTGITDVQRTYDLTRLSWQGDPCVPKQFLWEGLTCNHSDNSTPPTIISLDLSSSGLSGVIPEVIQKLPHLQQLDLSNNSLGGAVPEFLANMNSLLLIVEGNPLVICTIGSCVDKNGKGDRTKDVVVPVTIAVVVASLALIICALLLFFHFRRKRSPGVVELEGPPPSNMQDPDDALFFPIHSESEISL
ncbi:unnamed protein product [Microthlaspi erraticum]|uniref:Malectin-like domain-containing protein n=1 Tax=Microthlaspi erraticum TaxID=1685480 RepID=A0A6D2J1T9_9BRAS|nr:unnamed protein product [Microthlaspi erraticum]